METHDKLFSIWQEYTDCLVISNQWLKVPLFYVLCSILLQGHFDDGGRRRPMREHFLVIQQSRSGKGEILKAMIEMVDFFNSRSDEQVYRTHYASNELNPQTLQGGYEDRLVSNDKKRSNPERMFVPGMLSSYHVLAFGEARNILSPQGKWGDIKSLLLNALDDNTPIGPTARKDLDEEGKLPTFMPISSICAGATLEKQYNIDLQTSGMMQRFLFCYKNISNKERVVINEGIARMGSSGGIDETLPMRQDFYDAYNSVEHPTKVVFENLSSVKDDYIDYKNEQLQKMDYTFAKGDKGDVIQSFVTSSYVHDKKIAAIICALEGKEEVEFEHYKRAVDVTCMTIQSALDMLEINSTIGLPTDFKKRMKVVERFLRAKPNSTKGEIVKHLMNNIKKEEWDLGVNKTNNFIESLEKKEMVHVTRGDKNCKKYCVRVM